VTESAGRAHSVPRPAFRGAMLTLLRVRRVARLRHRPELDGAFRPRRRAGSWQPSFVLGQAAHLRICPSRWFIFPAIPIFGVADGATKLATAASHASNRYTVLLIFQAMDAAGKDGAITHVMSGVNPQGCQALP
jgi:hypothetical protein